MRPQLRVVGNEHSPVVIIDDFSGNAEVIAALADRMAPFPPVVSGYYPGVRRYIEEKDEAASAYVSMACQKAAQFIARAFNLGSFGLLEASFSIITRDPTSLDKPQRGPHFDSTDPKYLALLHYLRVPEGTGTAFYRQRSTGIERVTSVNVDRFVNTAEREVGELPADVGYIHGSNRIFEQIDEVDAVPDRLVIYQGSLLHSSIVPRGMCLSADPRRGRLTANLFVRGH